ncbi:peptidyl-prolyl cis-trans isomerase [Allomesorhizobium camelthorni]|uniref:Parvulin-like PPIase n=1 Tax=Allomesorhizobium camelthorni TaxID=475069 RepID=A0A6G4WA32_9HYPH|nr:peptidylprolyl isomerase [Mesorhizobium camelthorni]NGO51073.1 peptidyl-prolyl cis-trans isomerase [Mesorhizobium camelthorni]
MSRHRLQQILSEPLLHFFVVGVLVFGGYRFFNPEPEQAVDPQRIELTENDVQQLAISWLAQGRPQPSPDELRSLVDQKVTEEILSREAVALGLDRDDQIIKRRLAQKMDFLVADLAALEEPTEAQLADWYSKNSDRFALPPHASFRHLYFSPDKRGDGARGDATAALAVLAGKSADALQAQTLADPFMLRNFYGDSTPAQTAKEFGPAFAETLYGLKPGAWQGPVQSGYGWHLVWVESIEPGRVPLYEEVKPDVKAAWLDARYQEVKRTALEEMRSRYTVVAVPLDDVDLTNLNSQDAANAAQEPVSQ